MSFTPIPKNTEIYLCSGVPLVPNYTHTIYQTNAANQKAMFDNYMTHTYAHQSYQRVSENKLKIAENVERLADCNYLFFRNPINPGQLSKWYYAFIIDKKYVNDNTTEIEYLLDVMQTYYFDYTVPPCLVDREHTSTDGVFEYQEPEGIPGGEYAVQRIVETIFHQPTTSEPVDDEHRNNIRFLYVPNYDADSIDVPTDRETDAQKKFNRIILPGSGTFDGNGNITVVVDKMNERQGGTRILNAYAPCMYYDLPVPTSYAVVENISYIVNTLQKINAKIVSVYWVPEMAKYYYFSGRSMYEDLEFRDPGTGATYTAKNKKLLLSPYQHIVISNNAGNAVTLLWENFSTKTTQGWPNAQFRIYPASLPSVMFQIIPLEYRRLTQDIASGLILADFPVYAWSEDSFQGWYNRNETQLNNAINSTVLGGIRSVGKGIAGVLMKSPSMIQEGITGLVDTAHSAKSIMDTFEEARAIPDSIHGQLGSGSVNVSRDTAGFTIYGMGIHPEAARSIDNYFTMYGYKINRIKVPQIFSGSPHRPYWNYVKTVNAVILPKTGGHINSEALAQIARILDTGITFFMSDTYVGQYGNDNSPA